VVARGVAGVGVFQNSGLIRSHSFRGNHGCDDGRAAAGFPDARLEISRHAEVVPLLERVQRFVVDLHRVIVGVIVRQIGTGDDQRVSTMNQLRQGHTQSAAVLVALVSHDDGHEREISQHALQPRQLHFERVFGALLRRSVSAARELDGRAHFHQLRGKRFIHAHLAERRGIGVAIVNRSEIKIFVMRRRDHHHPRKLAALQRGVGVGRHWARVLITRMRRDHRENRFGNWRL